MADDRLVLISSEMPSKIERIFNILDYGCVHLPKYIALDTPVASHPDMLFYRLPSGKLLCDGNYFEANKEMLEKCMKHKIDITKEELSQPHLLHGKLGAYYSRKKYNAQKISSKFSRTNNLRGLNSIFKI